MGVGHANKMASVEDLINYVLISGYVHYWVFVVFASEIKSRVPTIGFLLVFNIEWEFYGMLPTEFGRAGFILRIRTRRFM